LRPPIQSLADEPILSLITAIVEDEEFRTIRR
jgi:hypothetical protein